jgi:hypothetical protein
VTAVWWEVTVSRWLMWLEAMRAVFIAKTSSTPQRIQMSRTIRSSKKRLCQTVGTSPSDSHLGDALGISLLTKRWQATSFNVERCYRFHKPHLFSNLVSFVDSDITGMTGELQTHLVEARTKQRVQPHSPFFREWMIHSTLWSIAINASGHGSNET